MELPSYTVKIYTSASNSDHAATEAVEVMQKVFDALSQRGYGSYVTLTSPSGEALIGNATEAPV